MTETQTWIDGGIHDGVHPLDRKGLLRSRQDTGRSPPMSGKGPRRSIFVPIWNLRSLRQRADKADLPAGRRFHYFSSHRYLYSIITHTVCSANISFITHIPPPHTPFSKRHSKHGSTMEKTALMVRDVMQKDYSLYGFFDM